jgi:hypothetical protein
VAEKRSFGQISRLPSKRYRARYTGPDQGLHNAPRTFLYRVDAEAWLTDERRLISSGDWTPPPARLMALRRAEEARRARIFEDYAHAWLAGRHDLHPATIDSYNSALSRHLVPAFGTTPIDEITIEMVRAWHASYGEHTPTARAHAYAVLTSIMSQALDDELIVRTPCRIKSGGRTMVKREPEVLTLDELLARTEVRDGRLYSKAPFEFMKAREVIGKPGLHWHDLRRTAATLGAQAGATVREMQSRLGHSTPDMALYYQGASAERDRGIADRLQAQVEAVQAADSA